MKKIYDLSLIERNDVAENTIELIFTKPSDYEFKIGQYTFLNVGKDPQDKNFARALSIASHPDEELLRFVMRTSESEFKQRCLAMKKGDSATVTQATGSFGFKFSDKEIVFLISGHERLQDFNIKNYNYNPVFTGIQPRINIDLLKEKLDDIYDAHYYIIGTGEFIKTMKTLLEENHIDRNHYLVDNFG